MHHYPLHIGDYNRDTGHLSVVEHGVYRLLMDAYYVTERPLPADLNALCRLVRAMTKPERDAVGSVAKQFFAEVDGVLRHKRIDAEIAEYHARSEVAAEKGRKSGEARRAKAERGATAAEQKGLFSTNRTRTAVQPQFERGSTGVELSSNQEPIESPPSSGSLSPPAREADAVGTPEGQQAEEIVALYPGNGNRYAAAASLLAHFRAGEKPEAIRAQVVAHATAWRALPARERRFCPGVAAYFADARWNDDPTAHPWVVDASDAKGRPEHNGHQPPRQHDSI